MDTRKYDKKVFQEFKVGELVKFVYVTRGKHPQLWNRKEGVGIVIAIRKNQKDSGAIYTVLSGEESFECVEVYPVESGASVFENEIDNNEK